MPVGLAEENDLAADITVHLGCRSILPQATPRREVTGISKGVTVMSHSRSRYRFLSPFITVRLQAMPARKEIKPPPKFSFVTSVPAAKGGSWLKRHSSASRSHAAYWGGPVKYQDLRKKQVAGQQSDGGTSGSDTNINFTSCDAVKLVYGSFAAPTKSRRGSTKPKNANIIVPSMTARLEIPRNIKPSMLQYLPSIPSDLRAKDSPFATTFSAFEFLGEGFVKQFVVVDHEDYPLMFSGCLLLSYAYSMALTGKGTKTVLLELKSQVIRRISSKMKSSDGLFSPQGLIAILALGAPIVCLVSQDLPKCLSIWDYINVSAQEDWLCCTASADTAQQALEERVVHRQAMCRLFSKSNTIYQDASNLALLQYVSNCVDLYAPSPNSTFRVSSDSLRRSMAIEASNYPDTSPADVKHLFPASNSLEYCSVPAHWTSPLTCQSVDNSATTDVETQMLLLAGLTHRWLATFLDRESCGTVSTCYIKDERANLRQRIERFVAVTGTFNIEAEAMYECCRWASLMLLEVEKLSIPIHIAAKHVRSRPRLIRCLRMTDLTNLWGIRRGLLFWVTAICHFSTAGQCFPLLTTTLFARFAQEIAMSDCCAEIAIKPLMRLKLFESLCCHSQSRSQDSNYR